MIASFSAAYAVQSSQSAEDYSAQVLHYLNELLLQKPQNVKISIKSTSFQEDLGQYVYSLNWSWGAGLATVYVCSQKSYEIKYDLQVSSPKILGIMYNFLKGLFNMSSDFRLSGPLSIVGEAFPGTEIYWENVTTYQIFYGNFQFSGPGSSFIPRASVTFVNGVPVSGAIKLYSNFELPVSAVRDQYPVQVCQKILRDMGVIASTENMTLECFVEIKDLLGAVKGTVGISTVGGAKVPGICFITINPYDQITSTIYGTYLPVSLPSGSNVTKVLGNLVIKQYLKFIGTLALNSNNPELSHFVSQLKKDRKGNYMGDTYELVIKVVNSTNGEKRVGCVLKKENGKGNALAGYNYIAAEKQPVYRYEDMGLQLYKTPSVVLPKVAPKVSKENASREVSSLLSSGYLIEGVSIHYVPRILTSVPEYLIKCRSNLGLLTVYVSGINGKILGASFQLGYSPSTNKSASWTVGLGIGIPIGIAIGVGVTLGVTRRKRRYFSFYIYFFHQ